MKRHPATVLLLTGLLLSAETAQAQMLAPAGTVITNQAAATFDTGKGRGESVSNITSTTVIPVCSISILPNGSYTEPGQELSLRPDEVGTLTYQVRNSGNETVMFPLDLQADTLFSTELFVESGSNGRYDPGDQAASSLTLAPGEGKAVYIRVIPREAGTGYVNLVSSCTGAADDDNNIARVTVGEPPRLSVDKAFDREVVRPGDTAGVTLTLTNSGQGESREVWLTDLLRELRSLGLEYVPGTARSSGQIEFLSGGTWQAAGGSDPVDGIRASAVSLAPGGQLILSFQMRATAMAENVTLTNTAQVVSSLGGGAQASDTITVRYTPGVAIGPVGAPLAAGAADRQEVAFALASATTCFGHTLLNTGDVTDRYSVSAALGQGSAAITVLDAAGQPLPQPVPLAPGAATTVQVCYSDLAGPALESTVTVQGERGPADTTRDTIRQVETRLPELTKAVTVARENWNPGEAVVTGDVLTYTLRVTNPYRQALRGVTVRDPLPAGTELISAEGATADGQVLSWNLSDLAAGETRELHVQARVTSVTDDQELANVFEMTSTAFPQGLSSNAATVYVWNSKPTITKTTEQSEVGIGDRVTYRITMFNTSDNSPLVEVKVNDQPSAGLQYVAGSSRLDGEVVPDPAATVGGDGRQQLEWSLSDIPANSSRVLSYDMLVTPEATGELLNIARLKATSAAGASDVASNYARKTNVVRLLNFAPRADILGTVFLDSDGNGRLGDRETGLAGARVVLAGGRLATTDATGQYHFGNVPLGTHALRLDPSSVRGMDTGGQFTQLRRVDGLTTVNFAVSPLGEGAGRAVTFTLGSVQVRKVVWPEPGGYRTELHLSGPQGQSVSLRDSLPAGAELRDGEPQPAWTGTLQPGEEQVLTYRYRSSAAIEAALAAPSLSSGPAPTPQPDGKE